MEKEIEKELELKPLKNGEIPVIGSFIGEKNHFGLPNKNFKVYLEGTDENGELGVVGVQFITPKARKMTKVILRFTSLGILKGDFEDLDVDVFDEVIDLIIKEYQLADIEVEKLTVIGLFHLISVVAQISMSPSLGTKK